MSKRTDSWHSPRLDRTVEVRRWGDIGTPVLVFPTAGGDAEEIERFHVIDACSQLLHEGRIKIYSCDSVNGRALLTGEGDSLHQSWLLRQFIEFIRYELVPLIRSDCGDDDVEINTAGSSIGAYNAVTSLCRYPDVFTAAIAMSGTYDLRRFVNGPVSEDFAWASPTQFVPQLDGEHLDLLRSRYVVIPCGEGANEDISESWRLADVLGGVNVPNRVVSWGTDWPHDWQTWREMLPLYLDELVP